MLLRFVVEQTLAGHADLLKERIAQYYQEPGHEHEGRIYLPLGCYAPRFLFPTDDDATVAPELVDPPDSLVTPDIKGTGRSNP